MGYKYIYLEVKGMKGKWFIIFFFVLVLCGIVYDIPVHAQKPAKTLTFLYSNNINGEIDPCPT
jgi:membrane-bound acyltransferase YfiQ involved in biofilm formation